MFEQVIIAATGAVSIWLTQEPSPRLQRWAPVVGLSGQPFWFVSTWSAGQWGMFALTMVFTLAWLRGLNTHWIRPLRGCAQAKPRNAIATIRNSTPEHT